MTGTYLLLALLAFSILALFIFGSSNADLGERLRKANARIEFLLDELDVFATTCQELTVALRENDLLATKQARRSLEQKERIAEIEGIAADRLLVIECLTADSLNVVPISRARATGDGVRL